MQMTDAEICRSYKRAIESGTAKTKQIAILSQLNACDKSVIRKILKENGFEVPQNGNRYTAKKASQTTDCSECVYSATCGSGKPDGVRCDAFLANITTPEGDEYIKKKLEGSKVSAPEDGLLKSEESENVGTCQQDVGTMSEVPEADGSERKQHEARVPDFVISIAVQKLEDMTKELNELLKYTGTLKLQINELRDWLNVATEGRKDETEESD